MSGEVIRLFAPVEDDGQGELFRGAPSNSPVPLEPRLIAAALHQVQHATPEMIRAAKKLGDELDLLCLPPPNAAALWHVTAHAWIQHHEERPA